ncbi:hypothetical protein LguiA_012326 [Lonicera macranthoides]
MRVLIRPPASIPPPDPSLPPPPSNHFSPPPPGPGGVVVVGFIGRRRRGVSQLINRIIDSNVFGSANLDKRFSSVEEGEVVRDWFKWRGISYYHEEEKGLLYLQFSSSSFVAMEEGLEGVKLGFDELLEDLEFGDLQGLLFMFSVCHVIIFIQEGSRFDIQILKKFRVLQAAKHAMAPFVRSQTMPPSSSSRISPSRASSKNRSPGKIGGVLNRNSSGITLMSGLGSYTSLFPGQCTPVTLFVFIDDFTDVITNYNIEESAETSLNHQTSSLNSSARPSLPVKGSGSVVVLSRPVSKSEGGFRKKLQSSLEAQIRFSIKKCRTLTGSETGHAGGSRNGTISSSAPLFSLDASKAVALVDRSSNRSGESLEFAAELVENVLNGMATSDSLLLESHSQSANKEDVLSVKEFIYRQADILRGRGGMVGNANSGSAGGVGMVAVAAAAAAASVASGKTFATTPELPSLEVWLSSSQLILHGIISAKRGSIEEFEVGKRKSRQRNAFPPLGEGNASKVTDPLEIAVSYLESGRGLNSKFSTLWCQRALPVAKDVYLNDLPACYPTSQHEAQLEKALCAFRSMVKGPAVQIFLKKLEDECTSIWTSGRQLCDAVSLTGKPCMHQRHNLETGRIGFPSNEEIKPHSSGFVFLHACACGRSRRLRADPFDFETANVISNCYPECDKILPALQLPPGTTTGLIQPSSWSLIRVGGARYYDPSKGLLQSGFCATQKFLLKWKIFLGKQTNTNGSPPRALQQVSMNRLNCEAKVESVNTNKAAGEMATGVEILTKAPSENIGSQDKKITFGRGIPNFTMRKPFSEVVAGSAAADSAFPPLQSRKQIPVASEKGIRQNNIGDNKATEYQGSPKVENISAVSARVNGDSNTDSCPLLQIGSNIVPVSMNGGEKMKLSTTYKHVTMYVGFEHECPRGHRFILTPEHLNGLGPPYEVHEDSHADQLKLGKNVGHGKAHRHSNEMITTNTVGKSRNSLKSREIVVNGNNQHLDRVMQFSRSFKGLGDSVKDVEASLESITLDDGGSAFSLLNRNLPIYMNCPHCQISKNKKDPPNAKFASTISQLQRVFLVTPAFPVVLATCPVIQFEASCLPPSVLNREQKLEFSLGCQVILPPESFLSLRLPFVYGVQLEDGSLCPLKPFEHQPELTAWITESTTLQVMCKGSSNPEERLLT